MIDLYLNSIDVDCIIGERPEERSLVQRLVVDVALKVDGRAEYTDELCDTVDYAALSERIRSSLIAAKCKMIERAARVVCDICLSEAMVVSADVTVTKSGAVPGLRSAAARCKG